MRLQVAEAMIEGVEGGQYLLRTPDSGANFFLNSCLVPCSKRPYPLLLDMVLAPFYVLLQWNITRNVEAAALRHSALVDLAGPPQRRRAKKASHPISFIVPFIAAFWASVKSWLRLFPLVST